MRSVSTKKAMMQKQIPTLLGLGVLVVGLVAGLLFFGNGTGVFAPRATPQTTPKNIRISNVTDKSFTVSFYTDEATTGFVKYGTEENSLKAQTSDDRDQLSGVVDSYRLHHITVRGLDPGKQYYYVLGTGSGSTFDNQGAPFTIKTAQDPRTPPPASQTIYGTVIGTEGAPAEGSIVYITMDGAADMSALVRSSGSWAVSLANARNSEGTGYATISDESPVKIFVQGESANLTTEMTTIVGDAQPAPDLTLGAKALKKQVSMAGEASISATVSTTPSPSPTASPLTMIPSPTTAASSRSADLEDKALSALLDDMATASATQTTSTLSAVLDLEDVADATEEVVVQPKPKIKGKVPPRVVINISVHSEVEYQDQVVADENGEFEFDLSQYSEGLEPGEHTVTYSYIDPDSGEEVEKVHTFYVEDDSSAASSAVAGAQTTDNETTDSTSTQDTSSYIAQADTTNTTYGSGNPYPLTSPTITPSASDSSSTRSAVISTESGVFEAGSVGTTTILLLGGMFFIFTGVWSWWLASQFEEAEVHE